MGFNSKIEWTETTWNPVTGCTKISLGCLNCYAERLSLKLQKLGVPKYRNGFRLTVHEEEIEKPLQWKKPRMVFVNSMSDLFHEDLDEEVIARIFRVMNRARKHIFQVLTKRSGRLKELAPKLTWTPNIWMGVTVEHRNYIYRIHDLLEVPAKVRFLSLEPLLSPLPEIEDFLATGNIHWVIVGGESGPNPRKMKREWVIEIRDMCERYNVPFFFKQWGGSDRNKGGRILENKVYDEFPIIQGTL